MKNVTKKQSKKSVSPPLTVGEHFRIARQKKGLDFSTIENKILVRAKYLEALEQSRFYLLPLPVYTYGFVQAYATYLGLNSKKMLEQFKSEYGLANKQSLNSLAYESTLDRPRFVIYPKIIWSTVAASLIVAVVVYLGVQIASFTGAPPLTIDTPANSAEINGDTVAVAGTTDPGAQVMIGSQAILVDENGHFSENLHADTGVQTIAIKAINRSGKSRTVTRVVKVNSPHTAILQTTEGQHD